jgi:signal transduction histidine kinase
MKRTSSLLVTILVGAGIIVAISLAVFYFSMHPPMSDLGVMARFFSITAAVSVLIGFIAYRLGWVYHSPSIRWTLVGGYIISTLLIFVNIWIIARLMFVSQHDFQLGAVLLLFALGIALVFSTALTERLNQLDSAASQIAQGEFSTRLPVEGRDEIAGLAETFNLMASQLESAQDKQRELEGMRRDLIAWISHDLQTPLASIRAILEALADGIVEDPETVQRYLLTAQRDIGSLSALIDDLFQIAQIDAGGLKLDLSQNSIADLVSDTLESFSVLAKKNGIDLHGQASPGVDPVWMDAPRIGRALNNLVRNALHHTPSGGSVEVRVKKETSRVLVEVIDTGEGIRNEDLPFVFDRFYRGEKSRNRQTGSAGLGLAIARGIIEAHHGQIGVESSPGQGTRFFFTLPSPSS